MTRFIAPVVLIGIAVAVFFMFSNPIYNDISTLREEIASYNEALNNSKMLENERDKLNAKYNAINPENLAKLRKLLPENVDNIRLILEIEQIALPYGMTLKDVKYDTTADTNTTAKTGVTTKAVSKDYGISNLGFSTSGSYDNFINFTRDLERNLRIVDISSVSFSSNTTTGTNPQVNSSEVYKYDFKIRTYWLKN